jgi:hypothetical protein
MSEATNEDERCECCLMPDDGHEHWCPNSEHPSWDSDPDPEARMREEDRYVVQFGWKRDET